MPSISHELAVFASGNTDGDDQRKPPESPYKGAGAPYILLASVLLGLGIGWAIDRQAGTSPGWTIGMTVLFSIAGLYHVIKAAGR